MSHKRGEEDDIFERKSTSAGQSTSGGGGKSNSGYKVDGVPLSKDDLNAAIRAL